MGLPSSSASSSLSLIQPQWAAASVHWLAVNICIRLFELLIGACGRQSLLASFCEHSIVWVIVSGLVASPWTGSHFGPVAGTPFPQALLHFYPCSSYTQGQLWVRGFDCGMASSSIPQLIPCLSTGGELYNFPLPTVGHSSKAPPLSSENLSPSRSLYLPRLPIFSHLFVGPQGFSPVSFHQYLIVFSSSVPCPISGSVPFLPF